MYGVAEGAAGAADGAASAGDGTAVSAWSSTGGVSRFPAAITSSRSAGGLRAFSSFQ